MTVPAIDLGLGVAVLVVVLTTVLSPGRRAPALAFLGLGVLLTLVWLRLGSVDVALAEAALGTGILSALLVVLATRGPHDETDGAERPDRAIRVLQPVAAVLAGGVLATVMIAMWMRASLVAPAWEPTLSARMPETGVSHPVTGVLLGFRAYDTLLESTVLMVAGIVVLALARDGRPELPDVTPAERQGTLAWSARMLAAPLLLLALWLLFAGSSGPGGAFQSGAVIAGLLVLLRTAQVPLHAFERRWLLPMLVTGVIVFALTAAAGPILGRPWLDWGTPSVFAVVLGIEVLLTAGIAAGLYLLYLGVVASFARRAVPT